MEFDVEFAATLATKEDVDRLKDKRQPPLHIRRVQSGIAVAATPTVLELGSPSVGRIWNVAQIVVVGSDDRTVPVGASAASYAGDPSNFSVGQLIDPAVGGLPNVATFSERIIWITSEATLFVVVYGAAAAQPLTAIAFLLDWRQDDVEPKKV